jgi:hypothetical protein
MAENVLLKILQGITTQNYRTTVQLYGRSTSRGERNTWSLLDLVLYVDLQLYFLGLRTVTAGSSRARVLQLQPYSRTYAK